MTTTESTPTEHDFHFLAEAAQAASRNGASLVVEADALMRAGYHARGVALAIASLEEDGKQTFLMRQATQYAPGFREKLGVRRENDLYDHRAKQRAAMDSIRNVFGPASFDAFRGPRPQTPLAHMNLDEIESEIKRLRENALYVGLFPTIVSPLDSITHEVATKYVGIATTVASVRRWVHGSDVGSIADYLRTYRRVWLAQGGTEIGQDGDPEKAMRAVEQISETVFGEFEFEVDQWGWPSTIHRKR